MHTYQPISQFKIFHGKSGKALFILTDVGHIFDCAKGDYNQAIGKEVLSELTEREVMPSDIPALMAFDLITDEDMDYLKVHKVVSPEMTKLWDSMKELRAKISEQMEGDDEDHTKWPEMSLEDDHEAYDSEPAENEFDKWHRETNQEHKEKLDAMPERDMEWNQPEVIGFEPDLDLEDK